MPERQSPHPDNELIDSLTEEAGGATPGQQGRAGGNVNRRVGTRDELKRTADPENTERAVGSDNPQEDAEKGAKTRAAIQSERNRS